MKLHIGSRLFLLVNTAKTIVSCANVVLRVKKEYKTFDTKLSWDKLVMAKCQKLVCVSSSLVITALLSVADEKGRFSSLCSQLNMVNQNAGNTISLHIMDICYLDVCIVLEIIPFTKNNVDQRAGFLKVLVMLDLFIISLFQNSFACTWRRKRVSLSEIINSSDF